LGITVVPKHDTSISDRWWDAREWILAGGLKQPENLITQLTLLHLVL
jgi:hypothetical protein